MLICSKIHEHEYSYYISLVVGDGDIIPLFIIFPNGKLPNFITREDWTNKLWFLYTVEHYIVMKIHNPQLYATLMNLISIILYKRRKT